MLRSLALSLLLLSLSSVSVDAAARPLTVGDLAEYAGSVPEGLLLRLVEHRGLEEALTAESIEELAVVGFSDDFLSRLLQLSKPGAEIDGVTYRVVDGVLHVRGEGLADAPPDEATPADSTDGRWKDRALTRPDEADDWPEPADERDPSDLPDDSGDRAAAKRFQSNPYPGGASGWGSVVFVPARFGDPPSSFGRAIVATEPVGVYTPDRWLIAPSTPLLHDHVGRGGGRFIPVRTSRGTIWLPN